MIAPGEFWLADIPYTDQRATKRKPMLVLCLDAADAVVTSAAPRSPADIALVNWKASGLRAASTVRLSRLDCLEQSLLLSKLGQLSPADGQRLKDAWNQFIKPQF